MNIFFQRERERQIVDIAKWFLTVVVSYRELYEKYKNGALKFDDVQRLVDDKGQSVLYNLKEACHSLFRQGNTGAAKDNLVRERLFDLAIGSFFHEAMKVREVCYQIEFYSPYYIESELKQAKTDYERDFLNRIKNLSARVEERLPKEFEELEALLSDTINQFKALLVKHCNNGLLVRFMIERKDLVNQAFGTKGLKDLFQHMFKEGSVEAHTLAAKSYFESGFYDKAAVTIKKIQRSKKDDKGFKFLYHYYTGVRDYYKEAYQQSLEHLTKAARLAQSVYVSKEDMQRIKYFNDKIKHALREIKRQETAVPLSKK